MQISIFVTIFLNDLSALFLIIARTGKPKAGKAI